MSETGDPLSDREKDVLRLMACGHTAKSAAAALDLSVHTVNDYLREARRKLGVGSSREAARALLEREQTTPKKFAGEQIGVETDAATPQTVPAHQPPGPTRIKPAWLIAGALIVITLFIAAMLATSHPVEPADTAAPAPARAETAGERAARDWIALVDAGHYAKSWQNAGTVFRSAVTAETWSAQARPVREPLGKLVRRSALGTVAQTELPGMPKGDYRTVRFASDFANATGTVETVVLQNEGGTFKVIGYFIQ